MTNQQWLFDGESRRQDLSQWYTPPDLAAKIAKWAFVRHKARRILEPSCGKGALVNAITNTFLDARVVAYDIDIDNLIHTKINSNRVDVICDDFLTTPKVGNFDLVIMNPPFENNLDIQFIHESLRVSDVVISVLRGVIRHGSRRWEELWKWVNITGEVVLVERPKFGGDYTPMQDFVVLEMRGRKNARLRGESCKNHTVEWW